MTEQKKPLVLLILDGFGYSDDENTTRLKMPRHLSGNRCGITTQKR